MDDNTPKESPILFNTEIVRAILDGRKTQTRRVAAKGEWSDLHPDVNGYTGEFNEREFVFCEGDNTWLVGSTSGGSFGLDNVSPHGNVGDRLWVKESYRFRSGADNLRPSQLAPHIVGVEPVWYEAGWQTLDYPNQPPGKLRPSIHMPRWASRITLEITDVRVERVQDISEEDAVAEGIALGDDEIIPTFRKLWDSINGKGPHNWDANPWVWVYEFRKLDREQ